MTPMAVAFRDTSATKRAIICMVAAMALFVVSDTLTKMASRHLPTSEILALRNMFSAMLAAGWIMVSGSLSDFKLVFKSRLPAVRGIVDGFASVTYIIGLSLLPIADCSAILLASPLMIAALSGPVLGEKVGWQRWMAVSVGFCGMLLVMKPGSSAFSLPGLLVVFCTMLVAVRDVLTRRVDPLIPTRVILFVTLSMGSACGFLLAPFETWKMPEFSEILGLPIASLFSIGGHYLLILAFRSGNVSMVSPFRYSLILFAMLSGFLIWGDLPDFVALMGIGLIIATGLYMLRAQPSMEV